MTDRNKVPDFSLLAMTNLAPTIDQDFWESAVNSIDRERLDELLAGDDSSLDALFSGDASRDTLLELGLIPSQPPDLGSIVESQSNLIAFQSAGKMAKKKVLVTRAGRPTSSSIPEVQLAAMTKSECDSFLVEAGSEAATSDRSQKLLELDKLTFESGTVAIVYAAANRNEIYVEFLSEPKALDLGEGLIEIDVVECDERIYRLRDYTVMKAHQLLSRIPKE